MTHSKHSLNGSERIGAVKSTISINGKTIPRTYLCTLSYMSEHVERKKKTEIVRLCFLVRIALLLCHKSWLDWLPHLQVSSSLADKGPSLPSNNGSSVQVHKGPRKPRPGRHTLIPRDLALWFLSAPAESPGYAWAQPSTTSLLLASTMLRTSMVLLSSCGPGNDTPENLLMKWSSSLRTQQVAFSSFPPKGLLPTFCKFTMSAKSSQGFTPPSFPPPPDEVLQSGDFRRWISQSLLTITLAKFAQTGMCSVRPRSWSPFIRMA